MDLLDFFGLKEDPFRLTPDPVYFYPSKSHNEALLLMDYSVQQKEGFCLIIGDPGTGKTTLLNVFLEKWKPRAEIAIILTPGLSPEEFLISVVEDLGINLENKNKNDIMKALRDFMVKKLLEDKRVVVVVDEAQNLPDETLEELRLLSNLETDKEKLLQIILIGQPELEKRLKTEKLRQLNQRITTRIHLRHFNLQETEEYINFRLIKAGKQNLNLHRTARKLLYKFPDGIPRLINMLASRSLMSAYLEESNIILPRHIHYAVKSLNHSEIRPKRPLKPVYASLAVLSAIFIGLIGYTFLNYRNPAKSLPSTNTKAQVTPLPQNDRVDLTDFRLIVVKVDAANIRKSPSIDSMRVGLSPRGAQFVALGESLDSHNMKWYQILYNGERRWICSEIIEIADLKTKSLPGF